MVEQMTRMATLAELRRRRGWTLTQVEAATNHRVSATTIWRIEQGKVGKDGPERRTQEDIAAAFGVRVEDIEWPRQPSENEAE